jgi:hypothetical protein
VAPHFYTNGEEVERTMAEIAGISGRQAGAARE